MNSKVSQLVKSINRKKLTNNTQKVLLSLLLREGKWVARTAFKVPSVGSRCRDLRTKSFGCFVIECVSANKLKKYKI